MKVINLLLSFVFIGICVDDVDCFSRQTKIASNNVVNNVKRDTETFEFYGDIEPLGFFDPLQITKNSNEKTIKYLREAELHHGRIAMTSSLILPLLDLTQKNELAINSLSDSNSEINGACLTAMGMFELARMVSSYKPPRVRFFEIKDNYQPGKLNPYYNVKENIEMCNKELSNGRLAMLGVFGYIMQELITQQKVISM